MACYGGLQGILSGLAKSNEHPSRAMSQGISCGPLAFLKGLGCELWAPVLKVVDNGAIMGL